MALCKIFLLIFIGHQLSRGYGILQGNASASRPSKNNGLLSEDDKRKLEKMKKYLLANGIGSSNNDDAFTVDRTLRVQEPVNPKEIGGLLLQVEAQKIATELRRLSSNEMGLRKMQVTIHLHTFLPKPLT